MTWPNWTRRRILLATLLAAIGAGAAVAIFESQSSAPAPLASFAPPGALLAIESPDFASLLKAWTGSSEQKRWLTGDDYAAFSRSRLFDRLGQAQSEFAATAGLPPDAQFLQAIAGGQSLLAWYDIGNLQFLYIAHMPPGEAARTPLLALRDKFEERKSGDTTFYVRTQTAADSGQTRTVAFAVRGDDLLLATREDLLANALELMQHPAGRTLESDSWYSAAVSAAGKPTSDLRMTLNLTATVRSPYFRSYWIQHNISDMKQYTAALSDLYRDKDSLREERVLLAANPDAQPTGTDLSPLLDYLPPNAGVYRAVSQPTTNAIVAQLEDKLLSPQPSSSHETHTGPSADLSAPIAGDDVTYEQRIDEPLLPAQSQGSALTPLRDLVTATSPTAMLTFATAASPQDAGSDAVFRPIHSAVVLLAASDWNSAALQQSLSAALSPQLTIGSAGLIWTEHHDANGTWTELTGLHGMALALRGRLCLLASDPDTLMQFLSASQSATHVPRVATVIAGFSARTERAEFTRFTHLLDHTADAAQQAPGTPPPFFSGNLASLSDTFQDLDSETYTETTSPGQVTRQTVIYQWQH
jgi:hypothetical protein